MNVSILGRGDRMTLDPVRMDAPKDDEDRPSIEHITMQSEDQRMLGVLFKPSGKGPHPVAIILHGFPGHDRNLDIAHMLRRGGIASVIFHYRGAWGSQGTFTFDGMVKDVITAIDHLETISEDLDLDMDDLTLIGHSMGGWAAMMAASIDERVRNVGYLAGFNLGLAGSFVSEDTGARKMVESKFRELSVPFNVDSVEGLIEEIIERSDEQNLLLKCSQLCTRRILMVSASKDTLAVPDLHFDPLHEGFISSGVKDLTLAELDSDHSFSDSRIALQDLIWNWVSMR